MVLHCAGNCDCPAQVVGSLTGERVFMCICAGVSGAIAIHVLDHTHLIIIAHAHKAASPGLDLSRFAARRGRLTTGIRGMHTHVLGSKYCSKNEN